MAKLHFLSGTSLIIIGFLGWATRSVWHVSVVTDASLRPFSLLFDVAIAVVIGLGFLGYIVGMFNMMEAKARAMRRMPSPSEATSPDKDEFGTTLYNDATQPE